jgi:hypothetical protein
MKKKSKIHTFLSQETFQPADSQGLRLQTGAGPPPVAQAFALLAASFFFVVPCTSWFISNEKTFFCYLTIS